MIDLVATAFISKEKKGICIYIFERERKSYLLSVVSLSTGHMATWPHGHKTTRLKKARPGQGKTRRQELHLSLTHNW